VTCFDFARLRRRLPSRPLPSLSSLLDVVGSKLPIILALRAYAIYIEQLLICFNRKYYVLIITTNWFRKILCNKLIELIEGKL
jgi:hypothetical protein